MSSSRRRRAKPAPAMAKDDDAANRKIAILRRRMRFPVRKLLSLMLCLAVALAGSGFVSAYAGAVEHGLGIEASLDLPGEAPATGGERSGDDHGCAAHLAVHLTSLVPAAASLVQTDGASALEPIANIRFIPAHPNPFFRPPRLLLA